MPHLPFRPEAYLDICARGREVIRPDGAEKAQADLRMARTEAGQMRRNDPLGHAHRGGDGEQVFRAAGLKVAGRCGECFQCRAHLGQQLAALISDRKPARVPGEEGYTQPSFQRFDLLTDSRLRHADFLCCCSETQTTGGGLKSTEPGQRRE